jgi:hypothetical protein
MMTAGSERGAMGFTSYLDSHLRLLEGEEEL